MFSNYLSSIKDVSIFPIIGIIIFFLVFIFVIIKIIRADKKYLTKMENLPLEDDNELKTNSENKNEIE
ncbi:MAG: cbb3-type cytochrome c oxidase subunit 3 [Bacteroidetes bacterium]|nr:cbb3-type cytochrome c oxidase subunit 3 [Bacteroidota bacterium]